MSSKNETSDKKSTDKKEKREGSPKMIDANRSDESVISNSESTEDYDDHDISISCLALIPVFIG